jgi:uncharacterized repeat protein (TIGR03803 family)
MTHRTLSFVSKLTSAFAAALLCLVAAATASAQTYKVLDTAGSNEPFIQGVDGNLYAALLGGEGTYGAGGSIAKMTPAGVLTTIYTFCSQPNCADGMTPSGLVLGTDGNFYGTTEEGGLNTNVECSTYVETCGTIFKLTPSGTLTTLYNFCSQTNCADGSLPRSGLVQGDDGNFYGVTFWGGIAASCLNTYGPDPTGCGTIFKITPAGTLTTLYAFCNLTNCPDGANPDSPLVVGTNGSLYGATVNGGAGGGRCIDCGTAFSITTSAVYTTLHSFCTDSECRDGYQPIAGLTLGIDGNFYGATSVGGFNNNGTVYKMTPSGTVTTLYAFPRSGGNPYGALVQASDGNLYGDTYSGATIFRTGLSGGLKTVFTFPYGTAGPVAALVQHTNGSFYGTTTSGVIFELTTGLHPFVETVPGAGNAGAKVRILGTKLSTTTTVSFNGTATSFHVVSNTEVTATVPVGSSTGKVTVTTGAGTLTSNVSFQVE